MRYHHFYRECEYVGKVVETVASCLHCMFSKPLGLVSVSGVNNLVVFWEMADQKHTDRDGWTHG